MLKSLLYMALGAGAYYMYQKHITATEAASLVSAIDAKQNADGSYTLTFPDGSTANIDAQALAWMQQLAPSTSSAAASSTPPPATSTAAPAATSAPLGALYRRTRTSGPARPTRPIYLPSR